VPFFHGLPSFHVLLFVLSSYQHKTTFYWLLYGKYIKYVLFVDTDNSSIKYACLFLYHKLETIHFTPEIEVQSFLSDSKDHTPHNSSISLHLSESLLHLYQYILNNVLTFVKLLKVICAFIQTSV
jgi:hypothetical protein